MIYFLIKMKVAIENNNDVHPQLQCQQNTSEFDLQLVAAWKWAVILHFTLLLLNSSSIKILMLIDGILSRCFSWWDSTETEATIFTMLWGCTPLPCPVQLLPLCSYTAGIYLVVSEILVSSPGYKYRTHFRTHFKVTTSVTLKLIFVQVSSTWTRGLNTITNCNNQFSSCHAIS